MEEEKFSGIELDAYLFEHIPHPVVAFDKHSLKIIKVNEAAIAQYGYNREEFYSLTADQLSAEEDGSVFMGNETHNGSMDSPRPVRHETKNGKLFWVEVSTNNVELEDVEVQLAIIQEVSDDITAQNKVPETEQPSSLDKHLLYRITKNIPGVFAVLDKEGRILHWNQQFETLLGYRAEKIDGRSVLDFFVEGDREMIAQKVQLAIEQGQASAEGTLATRNGEEIPHVLRGIGFSCNGEEYVAGLGVDISKRVSYQKQLEKSRQQLQDAQQLARVGHWQWHLPTNQRSWSDEAYRILGYEPGEPNPTKEAFLNAVHPDDRPKIKQHIEYVFNNKPDEAHIEYRIKGQHDDSVRYVKEKIRTSCGVNGNIESLIGTISDITKFQKANLELQTEQRRLQKAQQLARLGWWSYDIEKDQGVWSDMLYEICSIHPEEYEGTFDAFRQLVHPDDRSILEQVKTQVQQTEQPINYELRIQDGNGDIVHLKNRIQSDRNGEGEIVRIMGVSQDITDQKETKNKLRKRSEAIASSMDGISIADADGRIIYSNAAHANIYGFESVDEFRGKMWSILYNEEYERFFSEEVLPVVQQEGQWRGEAEGKRKDGSTFPQEVTLSSTTDGGMVCVVRDITERKQSEKKLQELLREKRAMLEEIHHRVKNNLAIISGMLQLQIFETEDAKVKSVLNDSQLRVRSIALVHEMLYESETLADISFEKFIKKLLKAIKATLPFDHQHISVERHIQDIELGIKQAIPTAILINELVTNAYKHAFSDNQPGTITVELKRSGQSISLVVRDDGRGLPDDFSLERGDSSIGMDLVRTLSRQLNGEIQYTNDGGARFQVRFEKVPDPTRNS